MKSITHPAHYGDVVKTLTINQPAGGGGGVYQVLVDKAYQGVMLKLNGQWVAYLNGLSDITGAEVLILGEMIEEGFGVL